jgi:glycosyltransferase involved in cell wall biosynthesis
LAPAATTDRSNFLSTIPALTGAEKIIVWPGGIWDWTDPQTLLNAMRILADSSPEIHLVFFAGRHPGEDHVETTAARKTRALAKEFQLDSSTVHFISDYIPYQERGSYLAECDAAVSTHRRNLESHFAYRARLIDCIWAGLPIVCTEGDVLSELVARRGLGLVVPPGNAEALACAIKRILADAEFAATCRARIIESRREFDWNDAVAPLARFCSQPQVSHISMPISDRFMLADFAWHVFKTKGARETWRRLCQHLRRR